MLSLRIGHGARMWIGVVAFASALAPWTPGTALAQDLAIAPKISPRAMLADQFIRTAFLTLRGPGDPRPDQLERTRILFDLALQLDADDPELWRLRSELAAQNGDRELAIQCMGRYCNMRPDDDAAQLTLIASQAASLQTVDERIAVLKKILDGSEAESFTTSLRSRLASTVAQGAFERGDQPQFRQYLAMALRMDPTNRQAAQLAYNLVLARPARSSEHIAAAMMQLLRSTPFDAKWRLEFARLLLSQGLFEQADQQFDLANRIAMQMTDHAVLFDWCFSSAAIGQFDEVIDRLNLAEQILLSIAAQKAANPPPPSEGEPAPAAEEVRGLPLDLQLLRLVTYDRTGFESKADGAFGRVRQQLIERIQKGEDQARFDLVWLAALFDRLSDLERNALASLAKAENRDEAFLKRVRAWIALNRGQTEAAAELLSPLVDKDPIAAYGLALCQADKSAKVEMLQAVVTSAQRDLVGLLAATDLKAMGIPVEPTAQGHLIKKMLDQWPPTLRNPDPLAQPVVRLDLTIQPQRYRYLEPIEATLRLHNDSEVSLALGDPGTLPAGALLISSAQRMGQWQDQPPIVVDMRRRITLDPGEFVEVTTRLDRSIFGALLAHTPNEKMGFTATALLNPRARAGERVTAGWMGGVDAERFLERYAYPPSLDTLDRSIAALRDPDPTHRLSNLSRLCQNATQFSEELNAPASRIADAVNERFAQLETYEQAWTAFFLMPSERSQELFSRAHSLARRSDEPMVRIAYLSSAIHLGGGFEPESPIILEAIRHNHSLISRYAQALKAGIEALRQSIDEARRRDLERRRQQRQ